MSFCNTCVNKRKRPKPFLPENFPVNPLEIDNDISFEDIFNPNKRYRPTTQYTGRRYGLFIKYYEINQNVENIIGKLCFEEFKKGHDLRDPGLTFYQTIKGHLTSVKGRTPFPEDIEKKLLNRLRQKKQWPAYEGTTYKYGSQGLRDNVFGFHEKQRALRNISS